MLVIDRVELVLVHEPHEVRKLHRNHAVRLKHGFHATDKIVEVRNLCQYIVTNQEINLFKLRNELLGRFATKELDDRRDPISLRGRCNVSRRLNTYGLDLFLDEILKKITVVARQFHDRAPTVKTQPADDHVSVPFCMLQPAVRVGRKIGVLVENLLTTNVLLQLGQKTVAANVDVERVKCLHLIGFFGTYVALAKW